jgi:hypothetical protein
MENSFIELKPIERVYKRNPIWKSATKLWGLGVFIVYREYITAPNNILNTHVLIGYLKN